MASSAVVTDVNGTGSTQSQSREAELRAKHKAYNRAYMKRWRANPRHAEREQLNRRRSYRSRKQRTARKRIPGVYRNLRGDLFCAFCRRRRSVEVVTRLKHSATDASRYVEVRMPYCGEC
jgi:hypothetical protein